MPELKWPANAGHSHCGHGDPGRFRLRSPSTAILCGAAAGDWIAHLQHVELSRATGRSDADHGRAHGVVAAGLRHLQVLSSCDGWPPHLDGSLSRNVVIVGDGETDRA